GRGSQSLAQASLAALRSACSRLLARSFRRLQHAARGAFGNAALELGAEMAHQPLDRPRRCVAERTDGVPFDLLGDVEQFVDVGDLGIALAQPLHHSPHPAGALAARGALAAALMLVEIADAA